jgi:hypothetical protein
MISIFYAGNGALSNGAFLARVGSQSNAAAGLPFQGYRCRVSLPQAVEDRGR